MKKRILLGMLFLTICFTVYATQVVRLAPLTYSIQQSSTTVNTTATALPTISLPGRESIVIRLHNVSNTVCIGNSSVTVNDGFCLDSNIPSISLDLDSSVIIYGIVASGTADIRILEIK